MHKILKEYLAEYKSKKSKNSYELAKKEISVLLSAIEILESDKLIWCKCMNCNDTFAGEIVSRHFEGEDLKYPEPFCSACNVLISSK